ncbi:hypothetical protein Tco_0763759 [Tanacetum coccineum]
MGGSYYLFPCSILSTGKDRKTPQRYPDVPTTSRRISLRSTDSFQGLTPKIPSSWHRPLAPNLINHELKRSYQLVSEQVARYLGFNKVLVPVARVQRDNVVELEHKAYWGLKHINFDIKTTGDHRKVQLNELNELCDHAYENSLIYKEKTKRIHDSKIKNRVFNVGDRVLLFNSRLKIFLGKLKTRWSGPFTVTQVFPYGTVELSQNSGPNFKVNGHRLKHYFGGDVPQLVVPDLQTFPMDQ